MSVIPVEGPQRTHSIAAVYPEEARLAGLSGDVVLECSIDARGRVSSLKLLSGVSPLFEAAIDAVMEWQYQPAILKGKPISWATTVTVRFAAQSVRYDDLMGSLNSRNEHVREAAARNLGGLRPGDDLQADDIEKAVEKLDALAKTDQGEDVRAAARYAAARLRGSQPSDPAPTPVGPPWLAPAGEPALELPSPATEPRATTQAFDYEQPPRPIRTPKPTYPNAAFKARIEGTVLVEVLIDSQGFVARSRVIQSAPGLDDAALAAVRQWLFQPAVKGGRPVATLAHIPVQFRIYDKRD